ncbi:UNVERIFIED_ORG: hypothetical protein J2Y77_002322 [Pseudomonas lini]
MPLIACRFRSVLAHDLKMTFYSLKFCLEVLSPNVSNSKTLWERIVIIQHNCVEPKYPTGPCVVLSCAIKNPTQGQHIVIISP